MITLSLLKQLELDGIGTIDTDLFWEKIPISPDGKIKQGVWIVSRSSDINRHHVNRQNFDIYARYSNHLQAAQKLMQVINLLQGYYQNCTLPAAEPYNEGYDNVSVEPTSGMDNVGLDEQNNMVFVVSGVLNW